MGGHMAVHSANHGAYGKWRSGAAMAVALLAAQGIASAQTGASAPPTREEIDRAGQMAPSPSRPSRLTVEGGVERAPCPLAAPQYANVTMRLARVEFRGLKAMDASALEDSWRDFAGRDVPVASLCEIRDRAATSLRERGFLAAVQVPPQRIEKDGTAVFDVLMARLVGIQVRGQAGNSERLIAAHLEKLKDQPVFNVREAERHLLLAGDLPGYDVRLALRPAGTAPGEVIGDVSVTRERLRLDVNLQNLGSHSVGRWGALARVQINDLTGMGDMTAISLFNTLQTREQTVLQAEHDFALGAGGLRAGAEFTYAWSKPDVGAPVRSETMIVTPRLAYALARRQTSVAQLSAGLDIVDQKVRFGTALLSRDRLRVTFARLEALWIDPESAGSTRGWSINEPRWKLGGAIELRQGLEGLGASDRCGATGCALSNGEADPSALLVRGSLTGEWRPVPTLTFALSPRAQYSARPLLSFEKMSSGNYSIGRGYDPGTITGDSGAGFNAEMRLGSAMPRSPKDLAVQPYAFFDAAWMWNEDSTLRTLNTQKLYSAGGGVRATWGNRGRVDLNLAVPLRDTLFGAQRGDVRLLLSLTTQLWPWRP